MPDQNPLFQEFPAVSKKQWIDKVIKDLKGRPIADLNWMINEHLALPPFYHPEDKIEAIQRIHAGKEQNSWLIGEDFPVEDAAATNRRLLKALTNGVNAPRLVFPDVPTVADLQVVFEHVGLAYIHTFLELEDSSVEPQKLLEVFLEYVKQEGYGLEKIAGGIFSINQNTAIDEILVANLPSFSCLSVDGRELSVEAADVVDVLAELLLGLDAWCQQIPESRLPQIQLHLAVGKSYFLEIAKIRAIHMLWANLLDAYGARPIPLRIDAYLSSAAYGDQQNTNMIRSMTMALSAIIGGVDRLTVLPADREGSEFTTRIARNVQHLLQLESYLDRVIDPAQGSYYVEALTRRLVDLTWERLSK